MLPEMIGRKGRTVVKTIPLIDQGSIPSEAWLYRNPDALAAVRRGLEEAGQNKGRKVGSFARYAPKT